MVFSVWPQDQDPCIQNIHSRDFPDQFNQKERTPRFGTVVTEACKAGILQLTDGVSFIGCVFRYPFSQ